ncbi:MAG TPA: cyclic nucleotide-binding domain-containing protein [Verrucomicrobiae bacterium]|nr:cyclic nucleotide-binding domain-containing protein [Verrucomicrobiae bacterium]
MEEYTDDEVLPPAGILAHLGDKSRSQLTSSGFKLRMATGEVLIQEGRKQDFLFVLLSGSLQVCTEASGEKIRLGELRPYDCFGEMGMLEGADASASVIALEPSSVWSLNVAQFEQFLVQNNLAAAHILLAIARTLSQRLREANNTIRHYKLPLPKLSVRQKGAPKTVRYDPPSKPNTVFSIFKSGPRDYPKAKISGDIKLS